MNGDTGQRRTGRISVLDPISPAIDWTTEVLFRPFDLAKWFVLGFCAWLAGLGERGGGPNFNVGSHGGRGDFRHDLHEAWEWTLLHLAPILAIAAILILVSIALWLLFLWLSSRGKFMFLDGVVHNRAAVAEPWHRFGAQANALFVVRIVLGLICLAVVALFVAYLISVVLAFAGESGLEPLLIAAVAAGVVFILGIAVLFGIIGLGINDFIVPLMYLRECGVGVAWRELRGLISARPGAFVLYVLVKIVIAIVVGVIGLLACCLTCCLVLLPYIGVVILLPLPVFQRAYSLYFLGQFGPQYARFATLGPEPAPAAGSPPATP